MSLSMNFFAFCLVATTFVRAMDDEAPEDAPEEVAAPLENTPQPVVPEYELLMNFTVGDNDEFTVENIVSIVSSFNTELLTIGGIVYRLFVRVCEGSTCIFAADLASRSGAVLEDDTAWEFYYIVRSGSAIADIEEAVNDNGATLAAFISDEAVLQNITIALLAPAVSDEDDDDLSGSAIAGIVIGCIIFVALIAAVAFFFVSKGSSAPQQQTTEPAAATDLPPNEA